MQCSEFLEEIFCQKLFDRLWNCDVANNKEKLSLLHPYRLLVSLLSMSFPKNSGARTCKRSSAKTSQCSFCPPNETVEAFDNYQREIKLPQKIHKFKNLLTKFGIFGSRVPLKSRSGKCTIETSGIETLLAASRWTPFRCGPQGH